MSGRTVFLVRFHKACRPVSSHFTLGCPTLLFVPGLAVTTVGFIVESTNVAALCGSLSSAVMILFNSWSFLSSYVAEYGFMCLISFSIVVPAVM